MFSRLILIRRLKPHVSTHKALGGQWMGINPRAVSTQRMGINPKADSVQWTDTNLRAVCVKRMGTNPRARITRSNRRNPVGTREPIEDLPTTEGVLTIIGGPYKARSSSSAGNRYAKEAKNPPQTLVHKADMHLTRSTLREPKDIVFTEADSQKTSSLRRQMAKRHCLYGGRCRWVHHAHTDALVIIVKLANSLVNRMLVDNGNATDILYWDAYRKIGLTESDLSLKTFPLYGFIGDQVIPRGTIKLAVMVGDHHRTLTMVTEFLAVDCLSAFYGVIERPFLKALRAKTSIYCLTHCNGNCTCAREAI